MTLQLFSVGLLLATAPVVLILSSYLWTRSGEQNERFVYFRRFVTFCTLSCLTEITHATLVNLRFSMPAFFYQSLYSLNLCFGMSTVLTLYLYFTLFIVHAGVEKKILRAVR